MTDDHLDKRLTLIEQSIEHMRESMGQRFESMGQRFEQMEERFEHMEERFKHMEERNNLRFERTVTRSEFYWGLLMQAGLLTGVMGVMLGLFGYGGEP